MPGWRRTLVMLLAVLGIGCTPLGDPAEPVPTPRPTATPIPTGSVTPVPAPSTAAPSASPIPSPTPVSDAPEALELEVTGCPGGVVVDWSPALHPEFHHYTALRSIEPDVNTAYPPIAPAVDWGDSYATDRFVTSAVDATVIPSDMVLYYRVIGYDEVQRPVAASPVKSAHLFEVVELGPLLATTGEQAGTTFLDWTLFGGLGRCFSAYQVLVGPPGAEPFETLTTISAQSTTELVTTALHAGQGYAIRVDAVRDTTLGSFVVARTEITEFVVP
jgi:hypothetical protein